MTTEAERYHQELGSYLGAHGSQAHERTPEKVSAQRQNARDKLTRLSSNQFGELSTDVYDEMSRRRVNDTKMPFLPVRGEFHPKRNQARQKLATLPQNRFKELAADVFIELARRNNFQQQEGSAEDSDDLNTVVPSVAMPKPLLKPKPAMLATSSAQSSANGSILRTTAASSAQQRQQQQQRAAQQTYPPNEAEPNGSKIASQNNTLSSVRGAADAAPQQEQARPPSSANVIGGVNFAHLDSLMADLGSMFDTPPRQGGAAAAGAQEQQSGDQRDAPKAKSTESLSQRLSRSLGIAGSSGSGSSASDKELEDTKRQLDLTKRKCAELEEQVAMHVKTTGAQDSTITNLTTTLKRLQSDLSHSQHSLKTLPMLEASLSRSQVSHKQAEDRCAALERQMLQRDAEKRETEVYLKKLNADHTTLLQNLSDTIKALEMQLAEKDIIIQELGQQMTRVESRQSLSEPKSPPANLSGAAAVVASKTSTQGQRGSTGAPSSNSNSSSKRASQVSASTAQPAAAPAVTIASVISDTIREYVDDDGHLPYLCVNDFQVATEHLFLAGRSDDKSDVLEAMRKIVSSSRKLSDLATVFEEDLAQYSESMRFPAYLDARPGAADIRDLRDRIAQYLQQLMEAAKAFAIALTASTTGRYNGKRATVVEQRAEVKAEVERLDDCSFCLTDTVLDLVRIMGVDRSTAEGHLSGGAASTARAATEAGNDRDGEGSIFGDYRSNSEWT